MSRHETLLGIYGAAAAKPSRPDPPRHPPRRAGRAPRRLHATAHRGAREALRAAVASLEQRSQPLSQPRDAYSENAVDSNSGAQVVPRRINASVNSTLDGDETGVEKALKPTYTEAEAPLEPKPPTSDDPELTPTTPQEQSNTGPSGRVRTEDSNGKPSDDAIPKYASNVAAVLALYGDGFLEIPTNNGAELRDGFSLAIRVFKAADIASYAPHRSVVRG